MMAQRSLDFPKRESQKISEQLFIRKLMLLTISKSAGEREVTFMAMVTHSLKQLLDFAAMIIDFFILLLY